MQKINLTGHFNDPAYTTLERPKKPIFAMVMYLWIRALPQLMIRFHRFKRVNMKGLKRPYIVLSSHASYMDFKTAVKSVFPYRASNVAALDTYVQLEKILKWAGSFGTRKFAQDPAFARNVLHVLRHLNSIMIIYPEGKYSLDGTESYIPLSLGKLLKLAHVPVVTLINHGHHLALPYWHPYKRFIRSKSYLTQIITEEEIKVLSVDDINNRIKEIFHYDDYTWQKKSKLKIRKQQRAVGLENILYQCPMCKKIGHMHTHNHEISCSNCHTTYQLTIYGELTKVVGETTEKWSIAEWVDWQKQQVKEEILNNEYRFEATADLYALPNPLGFIPLGKAIFIHDEKGLYLKFEVDQEVKEVFKESKTQYAVHLGYKHHYGQNCISYSVSNQTYFVCFTDDSLPVTKVQYAVEILYNMKKGS